MTSGFWLPVLRAEDTPTKKPIRIERAVFLVEDDESRGSGFLMQTTGQVYFVSNIHVLGGGENFSIRNVYGETVQVPKELEVASDRDLVRFPVDFSRGLIVSEDFGFGDKICALGNSGGAGVITHLDGEILALGLDRIEVSSKFIPGNSGGPIINEDKEVVGVSTLAQRHRYPKWIVEGSRFEETRRMAMRVDNVEWIPMQRSALDQDAKYVEEIESYSDAIIHIVDSISSNAYKLIYSDVKHKGLQEWLQKHNQEVRNAGGRWKKVRVGNNIHYEVSSTMRYQQCSNFEALAELMKDLESDASKTNAISTPYLKEQLEGYRRRFENSRNYMETIVETMF